MGVTGTRHPKGAIMPRVSTNTTRGDGAHPMCYTTRRNTVPLGGTQRRAADMPQDPPAQATVRAVDRALDILLCFARSDGGLSLSEIARSVHLHKSTVHRLLASLQAKGFVRKHPQSDRYFLGWSVLELISGIYQSDELSSLVLPEM